MMLNLLLKFLFETSYTITVVKMEIYILVKINGLIFPLKPDQKIEYFKKNGTIHTVISCIQIISSIF